MSSSVVILNHNPPGIGTFFRCENIARHLAASGYRVTHVCNSQDYFFLGKKQEQISDRIIRVYLSRIRYSQYFDGQFLRLFQSLILLCGTDRNSVIYAFALSQPQILIPAIFAKLVLRRRVVFDWDDLWGGGLGKEHNQLINLGFYFFERRFLNLFDEGTVASRALAKEALRETAGEKKITVVGNWFDGGEPSTIEKLQSIKRDQLELVIIGNNHSRGLDDFLRYLVNNVIDPLTLRFIGDLKSNRTDAIHKIITRNEITVRFEGYLTKHQFSQLDTSNFVYVVPMSDLDEFDAYRFPMRVSDLFSKNSPVIVIGAGEIADVLISKKYPGFITPRSIRKGEIPLSFFTDWSNIRVNYFISSASSIYSEYLSGDIYKSNLNQVFK